MRILSGAHDNTIRIWDVKTGTLIKILSGHSLEVHSLNYSPDGRRILSGSRDGTIRIWDAETGKEIRTVSGNRGGVYFVVFSPDGRRIISGSGNNTAKIWDVESGKEIRTLSGHSGPVESVAYSPDGRRIISGSRDNTVKIWDAESGKEIRTLSGHRDWVESVAYSPDGRRIVSGAWEKTIRIWDAESGEQINTFSDYTNHIGSVAYSPDGRSIVSLSSFSSYGSNTVRIWDAESGQEIRTLSGHRGDVNSVAFSLDGCRIISGSDDGATRLWNAETGAEIAQFISFSGTDGEITAATRSLARVDAETLAPLASIEGEWVCITPDGYYAASPRGDRYLNVRAGNKVTGIDSFRHVFYNPDVVKARLAGRPDPASKKTLSIQDAAAFFPPTISLQAPSGAAAGGLADIGVTVSDDNLPLQTIKIAVNGRLLGRDELSAIQGASGLSPQRASLGVTGGQKTVNFTLPVALEPGENLVEVIAFNGRAESRQRIFVTWQSPQGRSRELPNLWILAVGANQYDSRDIDSLSYCAADAREITAAFKRQEGKRYAKVNSLLVADGERLLPTGKNIRESLGFLAQAGPRDIILLFLAGHGVTGQDGAFYFLPRDARGDGKGGVVPESAVSGDQITSVLDSPGNRLVFIDACHSGGVDSDRMTRMLMDTNAFVLTASKGNEFSQERADLGHGVFTWSLIEGLRGAKSGLGMLQLSGQVQAAVPRLTDDRQHPGAYSLGFYDFVIGE
jgi:hypothetical protein